MFLLLEPLTISEEIFKVASVPFFIPDFDLVSCEFDNFIALLSRFILILYKIKIKLWNTKMENIAAPAPQSRFPGKLICCITFGSTSNACFLT